MDSQFGIINALIASTLKRHKEINLNIPDREFARRIGCTPQYVNMIVNGKVQIPSRMRLRVAEAFQIADKCEFIRLCILGELERDRVPKDVFLSVAAEPLYRRTDEGTPPENPGGNRHPGRYRHLLPNPYPPQRGDTLRDYQFDFPSKAIEDIIDRVLAKLPNPNPARRRGLAPDGLPEVIVDGAPGDTKGRLALASICLSKFPFGADKIYNEKQATVWTGRKAA